jgi:hypothetical protein
VLIDFHPRSTIIELNITNIGRTLARDVRFAFDPPLTTTHDEAPGRGNLMELNVFKTGIPSLAPGKKIKLFFDRFPARFEKRLPLTYDVKVSYKDPAGKPYSEPTVLDLSMYLGTGGITRHDIHDVHKRLKEIADSMKRWTDFSGLKVLTRADIERRNEEREAWSRREKPRPRARTIREHRTTPRRRRSRLRDSGTSQKGPRPPGPRVPPDRYAPALSRFPCTPAGGSFVSTVTT